MLPGVVRWLPVGLGPGSALFDAPARGAYDRQRHQQSRPGGRPAPSRHGGRPHGFSLGAGPVGHHRRPRRPGGCRWHQRPRPDSSGARFHDLDLTGARGFLLARASRAPSPRSASRARPNAGQRHQQPRPDRRLRREPRLRRRPRHPPAPRRWAGGPDHGSPPAEQDGLGSGDSPFPRPLTGTQPGLSVRTDPNGPPVRTAGNQTRSGEEMTMGSVARTNRRRRLRLVVAGAAVVTALTTATAGASALMGGRAAGLARQGAGPARAAAPAPRPPGVLGERGRHRPATIPMATAPQVLGPRGSNDPQLGPRPTAGRPADAPGGLTLTRGVPTDRRRRWRDGEVAWHSRASPSSECHRHLSPQTGRPSAANSW